MVPPNIAHVKHYEKITVDNFMFTTRKLLKNNVINLWISILYMNEVNPGTIIATRACTYIYYMDIRVKRVMYASIVPLCKNHAVSNIMPSIPACNNHATYP
jgi:hypothetical protein